ncbi:hypothetical protein E8E14_006213 [Neopestalotiopsis sp. 37M]|nr:hypothetical protein E8E14_006213 [Neopestalotiopsis sp. 37M]
MKFRTLVALAAQGGFLHTANAQSLAYVTELVTECFDPLQTGIEYGASSTEAAPAPHYTGSGPVDYSMPACECGCSTCSHTSVYSTNYPVFCSTGVTDTTYTITETYHGMSTLPTFAEPTECPYGFTTEEHTCTVCGDAPITKTMTYPSGGCPYDTGLQSAYPTLAPTQTGASSPHGSSGNNGSSPAAGGYPAQNEWTGDEDQDTSKITKTQSVTLSVNGTHQSTSPAQGGGSYPAASASSKPETGSGSSPAQGGQGSYPAAGSSPAAQASHSSPVKVSGASRLGGVLSMLGFAMVLAAFA